MKKKEREKERKGGFFILLHLLPSDYIMADVERKRCRASKGMKKGGEKKSAPFLNFSIGTCRSWRNKETPGGFRLIKGEGKGKRLAIREIRVKRTKSRREKKGRKKGEKHLRPIGSPSSLSQSLGAGDNEKKRGGKGGE